MDKNLTVILDCSGSFAENGKLEILRALRLTVARLAKNFGAAADFFIWRDDVHPMTGPKEIVAHGVSEISALKNFLSNCPEGSKILLLTDGSWSIDESPKIKSALAAQKIDLAFAAVGADANRSSKYNISTLGGIWSPADLPSAVQVLLFGGAS